MEGERPPATALRARAGRQLLRAYRALVDPRVTDLDAIAVARNVVASLLAEIDRVSASPALLPERSGAEPSRRG
jgi:hypothetical protein